MTETLDYQVNVVGAEALQRLADHNKRLDKLAKAATRSVEGQGKSLQDISKDWRETARDLDKATEGFDAMRQQVDQVGDSLRLFGPRGRAIADAIEDGIEDPAERAERALKALNRELARQPSRLDKVNNFLRRQGAELEILRARLGPVGTLLGGAVAAGFGVATIAGAKFVEDVLEKVNKESAGAQAGLHLLKASYEGLLSTASSGAEDTVFNVTRTTNAVIDVFNDYFDTVGRAYDNEQYFAAAMEFAFGWAGATNSFSKSTEEFDKQAAALSEMIGRTQEGAATYADLDAILSKASATSGEARDGYHGLASAISQNLAVVGNGTATYADLASAIQKASGSSGQSRAVYLQVANAIQQVAAESDTSSGSFEDMERALEAAESATGANRDAFLALADGIRASINEINAFNNTPVLTKSVMGAVQGPAIPTVAQQRAGEDLIVRNRGFSSTSDIYSSTVAPPPGAAVGSDGTVIMPDRRRGGGGGGKGNPAAEAEAQARALAKALEAQRQQAELLARGGLKLLTRELDRLDKAYSQNGDMIRAYTLQLEQTDNKKVAAALRGRIAELETEHRRLVASRDVVRERVDALYEEQRALVELAESRRADGEAALKAAKEVRDAFSSMHKPGDAPRGAFNAMMEEGIEGVYTAGRGLSNKEFGLNYALQQMLDAGMTEQANQIRVELANVRMEMDALSAVAQNTGLIWAHELMGIREILDEAFVKTIDTLSQGLADAVTGMGTLKEVGQSIKAVYEETAGAIAGALNQAAAFSFLSGNFGAGFSLLGAGFGAKLLGGLFGGGRRDRGGERALESLDRIERHLRPREDRLQVINNLKVNVLGEDIDRPLIEHLDGAAERGAFRYLGR